MQNPNPNQQQVTLEMMKSATTIKCEKCESTRFEEVVELRKLSKSVTGQDKDTLVPIPMFACKKCGHVNDEFNVENM